MWFTATPIALLKTAVSGKLFSITVEKYFSTRITIPEAISMEDYDDLTRLSELIADGAVKHKFMVKHLKRHMIQSLNG